MADVQQLASGGRGQDTTLVRSIGKFRTYKTCTLCSLCRRKLDGRSIRPLSEHAFTLNAISPSARWPKWISLTLLFPLVLQAHSFFISRKERRESSIRPFESNLLEWRIELLSAHTTLFRLQRFFFLELRQLELISRFTQDFVRKIKCSLSAISKRRKSIDLSSIVVCDVNNEFFVKPAWLLRKNFLISFFIPKGKNCSRLSTFPILQGSEDVRNERTKTAFVQQLADDLITWKTRHVIVPRTIPIVSAVLFSISRRTIRLWQRKTRSGDPRDSPLILLPFLRFPVPSYFLSPLRCTSFLLRCFHPFNLYRTASRW